MAMSHGGVSQSANSLSVFHNLKGGDIIVILITVAVILRVFNYHSVRWPPSIMMAFGSIACTVVVLVLAQFPALGISRSISEFRMLFMDFPDLVLNYMLGFLLFAAAVEVDLRALSRIKSTIIALSFFTTFISAIIVSVLTYLMLQRILKMDFAWCLLYGAIVSPTDPVAVISILNDKPGLLPSSTRYFVLGESLLNDAVGVVLYLVFSEIVEQPDMGYVQVCILFFKGFVLECVTGIVIGVALAYIAHWAIKSVDEVLLEVVITFVLVGNINMLCRFCHASIPLASVAAGLYVGNFCVEFAMSEAAVDTFHEMWKLLDETLNSVLFLLIGAADLFWEPQGIGFFSVVTIIVSTISISLFARFVSVAGPLTFIIFMEWLTGRRLRHPSVRYRGGTIAVLTWGGMRGGISIALALGVPDAFVRHAVPGHLTHGQLIFFMTFSLVVFSICVQGLFFEHVVRLISALSYEYLPSGGLGTYISQMNLVETANGNVYDDEDYGHSDGDLDKVISVGGEPLDLDRSLEGDAETWDLETPSTPTPLLDYDQPSSKDTAYDSMNHCDFENGNGALRGDDLRHSELHYPATFLNQNQQYTLNAFKGHEMNRAPSRLHDIRPPHRVIAHLTTAERHKRDASETFKNMPPLAEPPSLTSIVSSLQETGTRGLRGFIQGALPRAASILPQPRSSSDGNDTSDAGGPLRRSRTVPNQVGQAMDPEDLDEVLDSSSRRRRSSKPSRKRPAGAPPRLPPR